MARRETKKPKQPPFVLLDHNIQADVAREMSGVARFRQVGERAREPRFRRDAPDHEIYQGDRRFLFVTHDQGFLRADKTPAKHGGIIVCTCAPARVAESLGFLLEWWGPKRNLIRGRVFELSGDTGEEVYRDGTRGPIYRQPRERRD